MLTTRYRNPRGRTWKQLSSTELPHDPVRTVGLDENIIHNCCPRHPQPLALGANRRQAKWGTRGHERSCVWLPNNVVRPEVVKLHRKLWISSSNLLMCPVPLQDFYRYR
jgi:hypothetical protein